MNMNNNLKTGKKQKAPYGAFLIVPKKGTKVPRKGIKLFYDVLYRQGQLSQNRTTKLRQERALLIG